VTRRPTLLAVAVLAAASLSCDRIDSGQPPAASSSIYTVAHATFGEAARDFFGVRPAPVQPIEFPHKTHVDKGLKCTEYCHDSVTKGPVAGLPGVKACMICHAAIATDRPLIKQIAEYEQQGVDLAWQRVYGYAHESHVRFNHAPHIRANVECSTCHGATAQQTVAQRNVDLSMGFCVNCHEQKKASNDCLTCHF
jgi:Cytochrome c7 and related cytochrome c